jgi:hypothetical protein
MVWRKHLILHPVQHLYNVLAWPAGQPPAKGQYHEPSLRRSAHFLYQLKLRGVQQRLSVPAQRALLDNKVVEGLPRCPSVLVEQEAVQLLNARAELLHQFNAAAGQVHLLKGKLWEHRSALLHIMAHLYSSRQILPCKVDRLIGQPVVMHRVGPFAPAVQYVRVIRLLALLPQDIQALAVPVPVDDPPLLYSDHQSDESLPSKRSQPVQSRSPHRSW